MKYKSKKYTTSDVKVFALEVFDYLNGKINKKVPARAIKFVKDNNVEFGLNDKCEPAIYGATVFANTVRLDPNAVITLDRYSYEVEGKSLSYERFAGYIIQVVAHELSHINQDIDQVKFNNDDRYMYMIEITNELRTQKWIKSHYRKLVKIFNVKFDYKWAFSMSVYLQMNEDNGYGYKDTDYIAVPDIHTKLFRDLDCLFSCDILAILQEGLERGYEDIEIEYSTLKNIDKPKIIDLGTINTLLTDSSRAYSIWEVFRELMLDSYKCFGLAVSCEGEEGEDCKTITFIVIEMKKKLPFTPNNPFGYSPFKVDSKDDEWLNKYSTAKSIC
jgi:hypothetical protein